MAEVALVVVVADQGPVVAGTRATATAAALKLRLVKPQLLLQQLTNLRHK